MLVLSLTTLVALAACYIFRFDLATPITLVPIWIWSFFGFLAALVQRLFRRSRLVWLAIAIWLSFPIVLGDSPLSVVRGLARSLDSATSGARRFRVVTFNCAGSLRAARETIALKPDLLLLQESPGDEQLAALSHELFGEEGSYLRGADCSILARGQLIQQSQTSSANHFFMHAKLRRATGDEFTIVSLRLRPVPFRGDFWSPDFWRAYCDHRRQQRRELEAVAKAIGADRSIPAIVGGDFNAPAGDTIFAELPHDLDDSFRVAGVGWGNTILNDFPVHRIDQVWLSDDLAPKSCRAVQSRHSDHRMVVADFFYLRRIQR